MDRILAAVDISGFTTWVKSGAYSSADTLVNGKIITAINFFVIFSAVVAVIMLVVAGYMFITSAGDADKVDKATKTVSAAIIGMVIVFVAKILVQYVLSVIAG
jgi:cytochrome bd-type quinol oxidase subunit 2